MSSDKYCCVPGCKESGSMDKVLHQFPNPENDRDRFDSWLFAIGRGVWFLNENTLKYRRVCRSHFETKYLCRNNRISNIAVPTLRLPGSLSLPLAERNPMQLCSLSMPSTSTGSLSLPLAERNPMQLCNLSIPSTSTAQPVSDQQEQLAFTSKNKEVVGKENIDPSLSIQKQVPVCTPRIAEFAQRDPKTHNLPTKHTRRVFLSQVERHLYTKIMTAKRKIRKLKKSLKKQSLHIKAAKKISTNPAVLDALENSTSTAKLLIQMQWRENKKRDKGRRFTLLEKIVALSILKQSPKGYRFLRKIFILPATQTLMKLIHNCNLQPGINENVFSQIKKKADKMETAHKLCVLLFDEVSLKAQVSYNEKKDKIVGVIDDGQQRIPEFADHAQVFMVRGLIKNYKQPVFYSFAKSATKGPELAKQIKKVVTELQKAGLIVVATVCDQGTNNRQAIKLLLNETRGVYLRRGEQTKENIVLINNEEIVPLYDPPHLLKGVRNNLLTKNLKYTQNGKTKTAKWSHLSELHKENPGYKGIRLIPKLTEHHINPEKMNKMKVKYASQIFSRTVASNMGYLADKKVLSPECKDTADFLLFMDNIFDSVNGSHNKNKNAKPLLGPATPYSAHKKMWIEGKRVFSSMKFVTSAGKEENVPTIKNWLWTLEGIEVLLKKVETEFGITSVWLRHLNQDPLENFFGAIRSHGCRNNNPTCDQFESAFATLLINNLSSVHTQGKNCEQDYSNALYSFVVNESTQAISPTCTVDFGKILDIDFTPIEEKEKNSRIIAPLQYVSGYFFKNTKTRVYKNCSQCNDDLMDENELEYIKYREYAGRRWLCTPSADLIRLISNMQDIINEILKENIHAIYLKDSIKTAIITLINFDWIKCNLHKAKLVDYLINSVSRFFIFNYVKNVNKILCGKRQVDDENDNIQINAKKYYRKCYKRKLN